MLPWKLLVGIRMGYVIDIASTYMTVRHTRLNNPSHYSIKKVKKAALNTMYPSLSNAAAGVHGRIWSLNFPRCWEHGLNCVFRYCLISFGDSQCGIVPSLYWSRAAAMWALSSFSELQITTRDSPTRESLPMNETRIQNYRQHWKQTKPNQRKQWICSCKDLWYFNHGKEFLLYIYQLAEQDVSDGC